MPSISKYVKIFTFPITSWIVRFIKYEDITNDFTMYLQSIYLQGLKKIYTVIIECCSDYINFLSMIRVDKMCI